MGKPALELSESELEVLKVLWDHGPATVREVMERLHEESRQVAYTTVLTFLSRLEQKGYAASSKSGNANVYKPKVTRQRVVKRRLNSVIDQLFDGTPGSLVLQLMQTEQFSHQELAEFRKLIESLDSREEE